MYIYCIEEIFIETVWYELIGVKMSQPWHDLAEKTLGTDDTIERTYSCRFTQQNGYLCLGRKKMVFVSVKGFLRKSYEVLLDFPYNELEEVNLAGRFKIEMLHKGKKLLFETSDISARVVVSGLEDVIKSSPLNPKVLISGL